MASVRLENISKVYKGGVKAVTDFSLDIKDREFVVFVGPSGCGKSTTLRMIAGLEDITSGNLFIDGKYMNAVEPKDRDIAMVFQNYALYPHMDVYDNLAYPLRCHNMKKEVIESRVSEAADILGIRELLKRKPKELSGGQRQRVALGRAIVRHPKVFLLDEPLSNLDAKLRVQMRAEIARLHQRLQTTFIYVTHDQTEAMTMGDRIVVMKDGFIQQVDTPMNLYEYPANLFVATFLGSPQMNIINGTLAREGAQCVFTATGPGALRLVIDPFVADQLAGGTFPREVKLGLRPNDLLLGAGTDLGAVKVELVEKLGDQTLVYFFVPGRKELAIAAVAGDCQLKAGATIPLGVKPHRIHLFDVQTGMSLTDAHPALYLPENEGKRLTAGQKKTLARRLLLPAPADTLVSFDPQRLSFARRAPDDLELEATIQTAKAYSDRQVIYAKEKLSGRGFSFSVPLAFEAPAALVLYAPLAAIDLYDADHLKLTDTEPVSQRPEPAPLAFRRQGCFVLPSAWLNYEKAYRVIRLNRLGAKTLLVLEGVKTKQRLSYLVDSSDFLYVAMIVFFRRVAKGHGWLRQTWTGLMRKLKPRKK